MKKIPLLFLLITIVSSCNEPAKTPNVTPVKALVSEFDTFYLGNKLIEVTKIEKIEFDRLTPSKEDVKSDESFYLQKDSSLVKRNGDTLFLKTSQKTVTFLNNKSEDDSYAQYSYNGYLSDLNQFLVYGVFYEWFEYFLIDGITGDTTMCSSSPLLSPDKKMFITGNDDLEAGFNFNGLALYKNSHKPELIGSRALNKWGPNSIKWFDNSTLLIECNVLDTTSANYFRTDYFKLKLH
jgi:hypothetical protein